MIWIEYLCYCLPFSFCVCCMLLQFIHKWWNVSILQLHWLHIPFEFPMRKSIYSVNNMLCVNVHWNSLQLLKQYGSKKLFQIVVQFISLSCNFTSHLGNILWPNTTHTHQNYNSQSIPVQRQFSLNMSSW
mgnify:CR=1 FL=1